MSVDSLREMLTEQQVPDWTTRFAQVDTSIKTIRDDLTATTQQIAQIPEMVYEMPKSIEETIAREVQKYVAQHLPELVQGMLSLTLREQIVEVVQPVLQSLLSTEETPIPSLGLDNEQIEVAEDSSNERFEDDAEMAQNEDTPTQTEEARDDSPTEPEDDAASSISRRSRGSSRNASAPAGQSSKVISGISSYVQRAQEPVETPAGDPNTEAGASTPAVVAPQVPLEPIPQPPAPQTPILSSRTSLSK